MSARKTNRSPDGLEHGFTVLVPPQDDGDPLVFDLALAGGLRPVFAEDGQAIDFFWERQVSVLRYAKLAVTDAAGTVVPAWMEPIAGGIRIVVEDSSAVYPITVDPLATSASWTATGEATNGSFGCSVATAGDVNGDGYADVVVGAYRNTANTGKAYLYHGGGGPGVPLRPRQRRADLSAPTPPGGRAYDQQFPLGLTLRSPHGLREPQAPMAAAALGRDLQPSPIKILFVPKRTRSDRCPKLRSS